MGGGGGERGVRGGGEGVLLKGKRMGWEGMRVDKETRKNNRIVRWGICGVEGFSVSWAGIGVEVGVA